MNRYSLNSLLLVLLLLLACSISSAELYEFAFSGNDLAPADSSFSGSVVGTSSGRCVASAGDVDGDGLSDILIGAPGYDVGWFTGEGAVYLFLGKNIQNGDVSISTADYIFIGENPGDVLGRCIAGAGDIDADGYDDILLGAYGYDDAIMDEGKAYLISGRSLGIVGEGTTIYLNSPPPALVMHSFVGEAPYDNCGWSLSYAGDVDGNGNDDILIGSYGYNSPGGCYSAGKTYLIPGETLNPYLSSNNNLSDAPYSFLGESTHGTDWSADVLVGGGDVDGDGLPDIIIGAFGYDHDDGGATSALGKAYVILACNLSPGITSLADADYAFYGENNGDYAGSSVGFVPDFNGDGCDEIIIGAWGNDDVGINAGKAYIFKSSSLVPGSVSLATADYIFLGENDQDALDKYNPAWGDFDGDGYGDVIIGEHGNSDAGASRGKACFFSGASLNERSTPVNLTLDTADFTFYGTVQYDLIGSAQANAGDVNGDGTDDILFGSDMYSEIASAAGKTYLILTTPALHVDTSTGSDISGIGTPAFPFETISKGISEASAYGVSTVVVQGGGYNESVELTDGLSLIGQKTMIGAYEWAPMLFSTAVMPADYLVKGADNARLDGFILLDNGIYLDGTCSMTISHNFVLGTTNAEELLYLDDNSCNNSISNNIFCSRVEEFPIIRFCPRSNNNMVLNNTIHLRDSLHTEPYITGILLERKTLNNEFRNNIIDTLSTTGLRYGFYADGYSISATIEYNKTPANNYGITVDDVLSGGTNLVRSRIPQFTSPIPYGYDYSLQTTSICIDAGDPDSLHYDTDGTLNDMGAFGGPDPIE